MPTYYDKEDVLGAGKFGKIWLVKSSLSRQPYVLKEISMNSVDENYRHSAQSEVLILSKCKHENIIKYKDAFLDKNRTILSIIMEYAEGGDLRTAINNRHGVPFSEKRILTWFVQISLALQYLHYKNILHRDLKPENILLTRNREIKIGDFGISRILRDPQQLAKTVIGTPNYLSPEICQKKPYSFKSDIWSLGCILFELASLNKVFPARDFVHLISLIVTGKKNELPSHCSPLLRDLVKDLLNVDPNERPSTDEILQNEALQPYLSQYMQTTSDRKSPYNSFFRYNNYVSKNIRDTSLKRKTQILGNSKRPRKNSAVKNKNPKTTSSPQTSDHTYLKAQTSVSIVPETFGNVLSGTYNKICNSISARFNKKESLTASFESCEPFKQVDPNRTLTKSESDRNIIDHNDLENNLDSNDRTNLSPDHGVPSGTLSQFNFNPGTSNCSTKIPAVLKTAVDDVDEGASSQGSPKGAHSLNRQNSGSSSSGHAQCSHSDCHQCMLNIFWQNRIRLVEDMAQVNELKCKVMAVFKDKFERVYRILFRDWNRSDIDREGSVIQRVGNLNYQQVQSLPLMMQLIQLDILAKTPRF